MLAGDAALAGENDLCSDVWMAAAIFAADPAAAGGLVVRARAGPVRDLWMAGLKNLLDPAAPFIKLPLHAPMDRIVGGLDLEATLSTGRPLGQQGLLAVANGGVLVIPMAERLPAGSAAAVSAAIDSRFVQIEREGLSLGTATRFGVLAFDEGIEPGEGVPNSLHDRIGGVVDLRDFTYRDLGKPRYARSDVVRARCGLAAVELDETGLEQICSFAAALGIGSMRPPAAAVYWAKCAAAMRGNARPLEEEVSFVCRTVLLFHANRIPCPDDPDDPPPPNVDPPPEPETPPEAEQEPPDSQDREIGERTVAAERALLPPNLLDLLDRSAAEDGGTAGSGRAAASRLSAGHGRPAGVRPGTPGPQGRLNIVETLRAAAPWQPIRAREPEKTSMSRLQLRHSDFRVNRYRQPIHTTTIFVVDASGSAAFHRLAEAKGAIVLLLGESYVRRDEVALIAFRGTGAEMLLPPTRAIARANRSLSSLPGGGGTPVASGLDAALRLAVTVRATGNTPRIVVLTDGRANIALDGTPGREQAETDAIAAASAIRRAGLDVLFVDIAQSPRPFADRLAKEMGARYLFMPRADSARIHASLGRGSPIPDAGQEPFGEARQ